MTGRLNSFQRTMWQWDELHPYNAVHVARVLRKFIEADVRAALDATVAARGLGRFEVEPRRWRFTYTAAPAACELRVISPADDPRGALATEVEQQINERFARDRGFTPMRFFVIPEGDSFWLGLAYFHVIADADSIARLLREIIGRLTGESMAQAAPVPPALEAARVQLGRRLGPLLRRAIRLPFELSAMRRVRRPPLAAAADLSSRFEILPLEATALAALVAAGRKWEVTVNDVLLALLLRSIAPPEAARRGRRRDLAVGCIVNTRGDLGVDSEQTFGLHLGAFTLVHPVPDAAEVAVLAREVAVRTQRIKRGRLPVGAPVELALGRFFMRFSSTARRAGFYHKSHPLWGGVTNMNLNALWPDSKGGPFTDYFRGVSNGPATPLVLSATTCGDRLNVGLSWRPAVFPDGAVARFQEKFLAAVSRLAGTA